LRISINYEYCCAVGNCVRAAPELFEFGDDGLPRILRDVPPDEFHDAANEAAAQCPGGAIQLD
jgi:ferredoxin